MKDFFAKLWAFISSKIFLINFGAMLGVLLVLFFLLKIYLHVYTKHGKVMEMPTLTNLSIEEATKIARRDNLKIKIIDSVFLVDKKPGIVLTQDPLPESSIKKGRSIYLAVTKKTADEIYLPKLVGNYDFVNYQRLLKRFAIDATIKEEVFNERYEPNTILHLYYNGQKITEKDITEGVKVPKGSKLEFVVSKRVSDEIKVPKLVCKSFAEAKLILSGSQLALGNVGHRGDVPSPDDAIVAWQSPSYWSGQIMTVGDTIHVELSQATPDDCWGQN